MINDWNNGRYIAIGDDENRGAVVAAAAIGMRMIRKNKGHVPGPHQLSLAVDRNFELALHHIGQFQKAVQMRRKLKRLVDNLLIPILRYRVHRLILHAASAPSSALFVLPAYQHYSPRRRKMQPLPKNIHQRPRPKCFFRTAISGRSPHSRQNRPIRWRGRLLRASQQPKRPRRALRIGRKKRLPKRLFDNLQMQC